MGVGEVDGPPKKKLKQAQLPFCLGSAEKSGNKRKFISESPESKLALKVSRKESTTSKALTFNKENVTVNSDVISLSDDENDVTKPSTESMKPADSKTEQADCKDNVDGENSGSNNAGESLAITDDGSMKLKLTEVANETKGDDEKAVTIQAEEVKEKTICDEVTSKKESTNEDKTEETVVTKDEGNAAPVSKETSTLKKSCDSTFETSLIAPKLDQSLESDQGDPNSSIVVSSEDEQSKKESSTTPKLSKTDRAKRREEKIRLKKEKEELRRQKQEKRERKRLEDMKIKEEEKKKKEDERRLREEAKEEERKRKEEEKKKKEEERKKKEEAKEEEKRKKEEERKKKEESKEEDRKKKEEAKLAEERKEKMASMALLKFLIPKESKSTSQKSDEVDEPIEITETPKFMPFPVKGDMRLAVQVRHSISPADKTVLSDALASSCPPEKLYLNEIKEGLRKPLSGTATWPLSEEEHDLIIVESIDEEKSGVEDDGALSTKPKRQRAKLLQFHDNRRPPYWGTWRKKSSAVTPRRPFGQDKVFDYEVDSDSEWEDEEEGEDIDKEDDSDKEQSDDDNVGENGYVLDNTFVPHGYLSDEEAAEEEEEENLNPEDQKLKLKVLKQEFEQELKTKTRLKPRLLGCVWISNETTEVSKGSLYETLMNLRCKWDESDGPIDPTGPPIVDCQPTPSPSTVKFPTTLIERLVKFVNGSRLSHINLVNEFMALLEKEKQLSSISKRAVSLKIKEIAHKTPSAGGGRVWAVSPELCAEYNIKELEPPSIPPPVSPAVDTPPPKPKETALVNFLKKKSGSSEPKRRVSPTFIAPLVDLTGTPDLDASHDATKAGSSLVSTDATKTGNNTVPPGVTEIAPLPATPPVRKRIQPITLSKTVTPPTKIPTTPKMAPIFRNPMVDTPRPPTTIPSTAVVDLSDDS